jgi:hypothetical protein
VALPLTGMLAATMAQACTGETYPSSPRDASDAPGPDLFCLNAASDDFTFATVRIRLRT